MVYIEPRRLSIMNEVTIAAAISGVGSVIIAQLLRWVLARGNNKHARDMDTFTQVTRLWDEIEELKKQVDVERTARIALELENMTLKKRIIILEGASNGHT